MAVPLQGPSSEEVDEACAGLRDLEESVVAEIPALAANPI
jgi:hypothetical protein